MMERETITVEIRKIDNDDLGYLAIVKSFGVGVFFAYIRDDVFGAITLNRFLEMLRYQYKAKQIKIERENKKVNIKSNFLLQALREAEERQEYFGDIPC